MIKVVIFILPIIICTIGFFLWGGFYNKRFYFKFGIITAVLGLLIGIILGTLSLIISHDYLSKLRKEADKTVITSEVIYPLYKNANGYLLYDISIQQYTFTYCKNAETILGTLDPDLVNINYLLDETEKPYLRITTEKPANEFAAIFYEGLNCHFYEFYIPIDSVIIVNN